MLPVQVLYDFQKFLPLAQAWRLLWAVAVSHGSWEAEAVTWQSHLYAFCQLPRIEPKCPRRCDDRKFTNSKKALKAVWLLDLEVLSVSFNIVSFVLSTY